MRDRSVTPWLPPHPRTSPQPTERGWEVRPGEAGKQSLLQLSLRVRDGRERGPGLPARRIALLLQAHPAPLTPLPPLKSADVAPTVPFIIGLGFLLLITSQTQNVASQQGLQACQTRPPGNQRRAEIVRKYLLHTPTEPKPLSLWRGDAHNFLHLPVFHDQDQVAVEDRAEAVGNGQHSAAFEGILYGPLNKGVCLGVHGGSGFIKENDLLRKECCKKSH